MTRVSREEFTHGTILLKAGVNTSTLMSREYTSRHERLVTKAHEQASQLSVSFALRFRSLRDSQRLVANFSLASPQEHTKAVIEYNMK